MSVALGKDLVAIASPKTLCAQPGVARAWLDSVQSIATKTTPYLAAEDLTPVWQAVRSSACFAPAKGNDRTLLDYLESLARRDRSSDRRAWIGATRCIRRIGGRRTIRRCRCCCGCVARRARTRKPGIELLKREIDLVNRQLEVNLPLRLVEAIALASMSAVPQPKPGARN